MAIPDPGFVHIEERDVGMLQTDPKSGPVFSGKRREHRIRRFHLQYPRMTKADADALEAQFLASKGSVLSFDFTPSAILEVTSVKVKFAKDQALKIEWLGPNHYRAECVLEELLRPTA